MMKSNVRGVMQVGSAYLGTWSFHKGSSVALDTEKCYFNYFYTGLRQTYKKLSLHLLVVFVAIYYQFRYMNSSFIGVHSLA